MKISRIPCYLLIGAMMLMVQSCAPGFSPKPVSSLPASAGVDGSRAASGRTGEGPGGSTKEANTDQSSLKQLQEGKAPITPASSPLKDVYFSFDRYDLNPDARTILRANGEWLKANPAARVEIEGHSDERGTNEYNLALGAKRAQAVRDYLVSLGVGPERLSTISYGEEIPVCKDATEACWLQNRRARSVNMQSKPAS